MSQIKSLSDSVDQSNIERKEFDRADLNHDGYIQFDEFIKILENEGADMTYRRTYAQGFRMADTDQDGKLSYEEIMKVNNENKESI